MDRGQTRRWLLQHNQARAPPSRRPIRETRCHAMLQKYQSGMQNQINRSWTGIRFSRKICHLVGAPRRSIWRLILSYPHLIRLTARKGFHHLDNQPTLTLLDSSKRQALRVSMVGSFSSARTRLRLFLALAEQFHLPGLDLCSLQSRQSQNTR